MNLLSSLILLGSLTLALTDQCCPEATNIARYGEASQVSTNVGLHGFAGNAIDGCKNAILDKRSCTHTKGEENPWWRLDLKQPHRISKVILTNRGDCCQERLLGAQVRIGNDPNNNNPVCGTVPDVSAPEYSFFCYGMEGRYVSVVIPDRSEWLTLCEVEVFGDMIPKIPCNK